MDNRVICQFRMKGRYQLISLLRGDNMTAYHGQRHRIPESFLNIGRADKGHRDFP